jgi:two-component system C4-dicarboxylate transport response regulator DctD
MAHPWPGNVRELRNVADRFVLDVLGQPFELAGTETGTPVKSLAEQVDEFERSVIVDQLRQHQGNVASASEALAMPKKTLYDKIHKYAISPDWFR